MEKITTPMSIVFTLAIDGKKPWTVERDVVLENIPGAWAVHGEGEKPGSVGISGTGGSRHQAVLDFLGKNYAGKRMHSPDIAAAFVDTFLSRVSPDQLEDAVRTLFEKILSPPVSEEER